MLSNRPYLLRAFYQWILDSGCNPILVVDANHPSARLPQDYVEGDEIVFNVAPSAIRDLKMLNDLIEFKASFSGVIHVISAPIKAILAIYAEENGEGLFFDAEEDSDTDVDAAVIPPVQLKSVESSSMESVSQEHSATSVGASKAKPVLTLVE